MLVSKKKTKKRKFIFGLVMGMVFLFGLSPSRQIIAETGAEKAARIGMTNHANTLNGITDPVASLSKGYLKDGVEWFLKEIFDFSVSVLGWSMKLLNYVTSPEVFNETLFSTDGLKGINEGWKVLRDFLNMFFILMLLLVAFGTILRVPKFSDKKVIFSIIAAALLINFSKAIALVMIDISQLAMTFFSSLISSNITDFSTAFFNKVELEKSFQGDITGDKFFVEILFAIIFVLVMALMIGIIAVTLLIRLVAFYVLIILSPLAMFGIALPGTALSGMKKDWFTKMTKWAFFGPIMLFFLWLAFVVINAIAETSGLSSSWEDYSNADKKSLLSILVPYIAAIYLLFYGYDMAMKSSIGAANKVLGWGSKKMAEVTKKIGSGAKNVALFPVKAPLGAVNNSLGSYAKGRLGIKTKEEKDKRKKETKEKWEASGRGEKKKYERKKTYKQLKEWKDEGSPEDDELREKNKEGDVAAGIRLAELGKINSEKDVEIAMNALGKKDKRDKSLEAALKKEIKKEDAYELNTFEAKELGEKIVVEKSNKFVDDTNEELIKVLNEKRVKNAIKEENERRSGIGAERMDKTKEIDFIYGRNDYATSGVYYKRTGVDDLKHEGGFAGNNGNYDKNKFANNLLVQKTKAMKIKEISKQKKNSSKFFKESNMSNIKKIFESAPDEVVIESTKDLSGDDFVFLRNNNLA